MSEPLKIRFDPELVAAAREFNRQLAATDWGRIRDALVYALGHGGNLPPGFMDGPESNADASLPTSAPTGEDGEAGEAQEAGE